MRRRLREWLCSAGVWAACGAVALIGAAFLAVASYLALLAVLAPALAALVTGAGALLLALAIMLLSRPILHRRPPPKPVPAQGVERELAMVLGRGLSAWITQHPGGATAGAFATGLISGMSPRARRLLLNLLRDGATLLDDLAATAAKEDGD